MLFISKRKLSGNELSKSNGEILQRFKQPKPIGQGPGLLVRLNEKLVLNPFRGVGRIGLSKVSDAILQRVQKHWGERAATHGAS